MQPVNDREAAAQVVLRGMVEDLEAFRSRLVDLHAGLPVPPLETAMVAEEEMNVSAQVRSAIECVLTDRIEPAIRDLAAAASYRPQERGRAAS